MTQEQHHARFSDFIIYVDESGDHGLETIEASYPVFVLSFCIFRKADYARAAIASLEMFKFTWWGHDMTILHGSEISRKEKAFRFLNDQDKNAKFMEQLANVLQDMPFTIVAAIIDKQKLKAWSSVPTSPYDIALGLGLAKVHQFLRTQDQHEAVSHFIFERRGIGEDRDLELAFRRVCDGENGNASMPQFRLIMASKLTNSTGLQIADLVSNPIGKHFLRPDQKNRAYESVEAKLYRSEEGTAVGYGWSVFPTEK
jgi:hypothetical protein